MRDVFGHEATIEYDDYQLLPVKVTDPVGMETSSEYDYRVLQPERVTDPNLNISTFAFTPLGLMHKTALLGKGDNSEGDTLADPGVLLEYDLFAFKDSGAPVWVKTTQRVHHINADYLSALPTEEQNATIVAVEYSDGFGRQLQTRTQAEDLRFGDALLGDSGLPADQTASNAPAVGVQRDESDPLNVVVSGAKLYNNKGEVVEQWEPYFGSGFDLVEMGTNPGRRVRIYYDALGRPKRTVNPDGTEQRVVYGRPNALNTPNSFTPTPWERYTYDANDLAGITHPGDTTVPAEHRWTPKSEVVDALGRTVRTTEHNAHYDQQVSPAVYQDVVMQYAYDIKGQLLQVTDPLGRICFEHKYDTAGNNLWTKHLDSGEKTLVVDAQGKPLYSGDAKGAAVYTAYDDLNRPTDIWAKDATGEDVTLRQHMVYGDAEHPDPAATNHKGQIWKHYDEAGFVEVEAYDFKGNPLEKRRLVINDDELADQEKYVVDWTGLDDEILDDEHPYVTSLNYDGLNRVRAAQYPKDVEDERKILTPTYNRAGALEQVELDGTTYIEHIAYNAKGQRLLMAMGNGVMTRYAYDPVTFRLLRIRSERYALNGNNYEPQSGSTKQDSAFDYDLGGNILKIKDRVSDCGISGSTLGVNALDRVFSYDPLKRLLQATGRESNTTSNSDFWQDKPLVGSPNANHTRAYSQGFEYDKVGNILKLAHTATGNSYTRRYNYVSGLNHLASIDNGQGIPTVHASFLYDDAGNQVQVNTDRHFEWDGADQLRYFKREASSSITSAAHYLYAGGQRIKKFVRDGSGGVEVTVYIDGVYEHRYQKNSGGTVLKEQTVLHVMDGRSRVATTHLGDEFGDFVDVDEPTHYNLEDHLGTSMARLDHNGTVLDRMEYYPFGDTSMQTTEHKRYRYVGKELDSESGLHYYGARYYAAWVGRFISIDPLADKYAQLTPYNYAANGPVGDLDLDGQQTPGTDPAVGTAGAGNQAPAPLTRDANSNAVTRIEQRVQAIEASGGPKIPNTTARTYSVVAIPPIEVKNPQDATATDVLRIPHTAPVLSGPSGPTAEEAAHLARHSYGDSDASDLLNGWALATSKMAEMTKAGVVFEDPATGLRSALYERTHEYGGTEYVYATAGTNDFIDAKEDVKQALGLNAPQYALSVKNARVLSDALQGSNLTFVGHSLGGGLASANAFATGRDAVTFNAAGLHPATMIANGLNMRANIDAYIVSGEIVDHSQRLVGLIAAGNRHYMHALYAPDLPGTLADDAINLKERIKNHLMDAVIDKMRQQGIKYR